MEEVERPRIIQRIEVFTITHDIHVSDRWYVEVQCGGVCDASPAGEVATRGERTVAFTRRGDGREVTPGWWGARDRNGREPRQLPATDVAGGQDLTKPMAGGGEAPRR